MAVLSCRAAVVIRTLTFVSGIIRRHRISIGSLRRKLNPVQQALLVLVDPHIRRDVRRTGRRVRGGISPARHLRRINGATTSVGAMKVLIAGGAGYIGSTIASACLDAGIIPVILDSLMTGRREFTVGREFYEGDIADGPLVDRVFAEHPDIGTVIHCAALIVVPDSVTDPVGYYRANVAKSLDFVAHLLRNSCTRLIFSSSAAIYRSGDDLSVDEDSPVDPQSSYARTKAACEVMFADIAAALPIRVLSLRYFNPIGADPKMRTGLQLLRPTHVLGRMIQALEEGVPFMITGTDYPTRDGSGIRDFIHVWDLATAHVAALAKFDTLPGPTTVINLGTGRGTTVRELLDAFNRVAPSPIQARDAGRRPGDVVGAYTRSDRARRLLGWQPQYDITEGIRHALQWAAIRGEVLSEDVALWPGATRWHTLAAEML